MAITLKKGQGISLKKTQYDLSKVCIGLGWDLPTPKKIFGGLLQKQEFFDLDALAILLDEHGKVKDLGTIQADGSPGLVNADIVFYNSPRHPSGAIWHSGDSRTGEEDSEDDEQLFANLLTVPPRIQRISFVVLIYNGVERRQAFERIPRAYIRAVDAKNVEMARFNLSADPTYTGCYSMVFAELAREDAEQWKFTAIGQGLETDRLTQILKHY